MTCDRPVCVEGRWLCVRVEGVGGRGVMRCYGLWRGVSKGVSCKGERCYECNVLVVIGEVGPGGV